MEPSLQERYAPTSRCFGCGPANDKGLRIRSIPLPDGRVVATWRPEKHHEAFDDILNGGICGALLDCHMNWTAAHHLMGTKGLDAPPCTVTAEFAIQLLAPTPTGGELELEARVVESSGSKALVESTLSANGVVTAKGRGTFVAVKPGHPAYHRWG